MGLKIWPKPPRPQQFLLLFQTMATSLHASRLGSVAGDFWARHRGRRLGGLVFFFFN